MRAYLARECCRELELSRPSRKLDVAAKKRPKFLRTPALELNRSRARPPIQDLSRLRVEAVEIVLGVLGPFAFELAGCDNSHQLVQRTMNFYHNPVSLLYMRSNAQPTLQHCFRLIYLRLDGADFRFVARAIRTTPPIRHLGPLALRRKASSAFRGSLSKQSRPWC